MIIEECILKSMGADFENYNIGDIVFSEDSVPFYYYQIIEGEVKLNNFTEDGKEVIQSILKKGQGIGESFLFLDQPYPVNAIAITSCKIAKLPRCDFFTLLEQFPEVCLNIISDLSGSIHFKFVMGQNISSQNPATKIKSLLDYLKSSHPDKTPFSFQIPLTRQQIASFTGLCVETAIRTIKLMERDNLVKICNRKILY